MTRGRTPPHDTEAEAALLGAMLLTRDARQAALDSGITGADFHAPRHGLIFDAIARVHDAGAGVDPVTLANVLARTDELEAIGGQRTLMRLQAACPASWNVGTWAGIVAETARLRRVIAYAGELTEAAYTVGEWGADEHRVDRMLTDGPLVLAPPGAPVEATELDALLAQPPPVPKPWVVPGLLLAGDVMVLTGGEGAGKMTVLRQLALGVAAGIHPFTDRPMKRGNVLIVDLQEDMTDLRAELARPHRHVRAHYRTGAVHLIARRQGMNLLGGRDARAFEALLAEHQPTLVVMGPLKKCYQPPTGKGIWDDDVVEALHRRFDEWIVEHGFALVMEGHAGHDRETWRVKGSSAWYAWPHFGYGLAPETWQPRDCKLVRWRGDRENGVPRAWPARLTESPGGWPWQANKTAVEAMIRIGDAGDPIDQPSLDEQEPF